MGHHIGQRFTAFFQAGEDAQIHHSHGLGTADHFGPVGNCIQEFMLGIHQPGLHHGGGDLARV